MRPTVMRVARQWASTSSATATDSSKRLRIAVVGTGRMGEIRLAGLQQLSNTFEIAAIIDASLATDSSAAHALSRRFQTPTFTSLASAAASLAAVDGVWIATPTPTHLDVIHHTLSLASSPSSSSILRAIGIEKPVGATLADIDEAYNACAQHRVALLCSFQRRFDPSYQALATAVTTTKRIGAVQSIHATFRDNPCPPVAFLKTGGDPFHDLAVHDIDYVCALLNEYPTRVYAHGSTLSQELKDAGVMDKASVWLEFERSGVVCTMDLSRRADYGYDQRIEVCGERGMLQVRNPTVTTFVGADADGEHHSVGVHSFPQRFREAYMLELMHFADVLRGRSHPRVHWNAARTATAVAEAARLAAVHRKVVTIKYDRTRQDHPHQDPYVAIEYVY